MESKKINVLMVCLGNICRSPTAEAVFRKVVEDRGLDAKIHIDSAGTGDWHIDHPPDKRATKAAAQRDIDLTPLRARQVKLGDFDEYDYIFAMDKTNLYDLMSYSAPPQHNKIKLFLTFPHGDSSHLSLDYEEVPDPYYSGPEGFELVLDLIEDASKHILDTIVKTHKLD